MENNKEQQPVFTQAPAKISEARTKLFASSDFLNAPIVYQTMVKGLLTEEYERNLDYIVKVATNKQVIAKQDLGTISKVAEAHPWPDEIEQGKEDNYRFIMKTLTDDVILNQPDVEAIIDTVLMSGTSIEAQRSLGIIAKRIATDVQLKKLEQTKEQEQQPVFTQAPEKISEARSKLFASESYLNAPVVFRTMTEGLLTEEYEENLDYIVKAATNEQVIAKQNLDIVSKIANAHPWAEEREQKSKDSYHFVMNVLTSEQLLNRADASSIIDSVLKSKTGKEAELQARAINTIYGKPVDDSLNTMLEESVIMETPQQENTGMKR